MISAEWIERLVDETDGALTSARAEAAEARDWPEVAGELELGCFELENALRNFRRALALANAGAAA